MIRFCRNAVFVAVLLAVACAAQERTTPGSRPQDTNTLADFQARIAKYESVRGKVDEGKPTDSASEVKHRQHELAEKVAEKREHVKQGDIFTPEISEYFKRQIALTMRGKEGARIRMSLRGAEPVNNVPLKVNATYPSNVPLQSTPPTLLLNLPRLPKGLQYRIVNHALVLYDSSTNLIVDYLPDAVPVS